MTGATYAPEFKSGAVERVRAGETASAVGRDIAVNGSLVAKWVKQAKGKRVVKAKGKPKLRHGGIPGTYSEETKQRAMARVRAGETGAAVGRDMKIGNGMVSYWLKRDKTAAAHGLNGHATNGAAQPGNSGAVLDAIVFLKQAKKAIHKRTAKGQAGLEDPVALLSMLALQTLLGGLE